MGTKASDGKNPWHRVSAWLPPGLALAWLATLATVVRSVGMALAAWGATVSAILLAVLLINQLRKRRPAGGDDSVARTHDATAEEEEQEQASTPAQADPDEPAQPPTTAEPQETGEKNLGPPPGLSGRTPVIPGSPVPELRVLTAEEAASVLRVDTELVKASISSGELPGNRIGPHWRIEKEALTRWLQGTYKS